MNTVPTVPTLRWCLCCGSEWTQGLAGNVCPDCGGDVATRPSPASEYRPGQTYPGQTYIPPPESRPWASTERYGSGKKWRGKAWVIIGAFLFGAWLLLYLVPGIVFVDSVSQVQANCFSTLLRALTPSSCSLATGLGWVAASSWAKRWCPYPG